MATTEVDESGTGALEVIRRAWPLLASIGLLMTGSGLQGSLLGVRAEAAGFDSAVTGIVLGLYYLGYVAGSEVVPRLIRSVGHIRVFSSLASLASAAVVIHGVWVVPGAWMVLRFLTGLCVAGLFIVSESWLSDVSTPYTRGVLLATYNTVVTGGLAVGSLLLNAADALGITLFVVGSVLLSLAAVPVALAPHDAPPPRAHEPRSVLHVIRTAPLGVAGAMLSGFGTGASLGFGAVYATRAGFGVSGASQFLAAILLGAVIGQIPLGRWSDRTDRRLVMAVASALIVVGAATGVAATTAESFPAALGAAALVGAGAFSLYGLSFAHVADYCDPAALPATGARIITVNGLGAAAGPISAAVAIGIFGPQGLFHVLGAAATLFVILVGYRLFRRRPVAASDRSAYVSVSTAATIAGVDEVASEVVGFEYEDHWEGDDDWDGDERRRPGARRRAAERRVVEDLREP